MRWITQAQVKAAARKSDKASISMSMKHWFQLTTATKKEIIDGYNDDKVDIWGEHCALCGRYSDGYENCGKCPLTDEGRSDCCEEWRNAVELWNPEDGYRWKHRAFQKAAKVLYKRICNLSSK